MGAEEFRRGPDYHHQTSCTGATQKYFFDQKFTFVTFLVLKNKYAPHWYYPPTTHILVSASDQNHFYLLVRHFELTYSFAVVHEIT